MDERKAAHEGGDRLEQIEARLPVDHRRFVLVAMKQANDIVALQNREQCGAVVVAPPMRRGRSPRRRRSSSPDPISPARRIPAIVLEQDHRPAVGCRIGEILLQPAQAADRRPCWCRRRNAATAPDAGRPNPRNSCRNSIS